MHALIHRALAPQTVAYVWLVFTVALTLALAVAQSAIAAPSSAAAASIRPLLAPALATGDVLAAPAPAPDRAGVVCPDRAPDAGARRCATARPAAPSLPNLRLDAGRDEPQRRARGLVRHRGAARPSYRRSDRHDPRDPRVHGSLAALSHPRLEPELCAPGPSRLTAAAPIGAPL